MSTGKFKIVDGERIELTVDELVPDLTEEQIAAAEAEAELQHCLMTRQSQYASITEQLDQLYWDQVNGTTVWRDGIAAVKAANPKPTS